MKTFLVEMHGDVREVYSVEAETAEEAQENWADGHLVNSEAQGMTFYSVREND
jgi:hypothetical protein